MILLPTPPKTGTDWLKQQSQKAAMSDHPVLACDPTEARDSEVERWLQSYGVKYAPKTMIPMALVDEKGSLGNQARQEPLVQESVDAFSAAYKRGEYLPPIVGFQVGGKIRIVDGNNRYGGRKKAGEAFIPGYIIDPATPSEVIERLTINANASHGVRPPLTWRVRQAAYLVSLGFTADQASVDAGVSRSQLSAYQAVVKADARAKALKISGFADLAATSRQSLGAIHNDPVFYQAARTAIDSAMNRDEVSKFVKDVKAFKDEGSAISFIGQVATSRKLEAQTAAAGTSNRVSSPKHSLVTALGKLQHVDPAALARAVITDLERQEIIKRCYAASEALLEITTALEAKEVRDAG